ncbi:MAG: Fic family protein [Verrucomicrobia bacterium]|jgi:Fic family protein|nr:Fic family protein [Verrucomicrobiota bacterium]
MYNRRQELILGYVKAQEKVSRKEVETYISRAFPEKNSRITILRDLELLIADGLVARTGKARGTTYHPSSRSVLLDTLDVNAYFDQDQDQRILRSESFNFDIWPHLTGLLTEAEKVELDALNQQYREGRASMTPTVLQKELERLTIEFSWKSSKIEGNTYALLDTEQLIKNHAEATGKTRAEAVMILNHKDALDFVFKSADFFKKLSPAKIEDVHRLLVRDLGVTHGIRKNLVRITGTNYRPPDNVFQIQDAMNALCALVNQTAHPIEKALIAVLMISYIQPFEDGNKRASRILGNALLLAYNCCPLSYRSVDEVEYKKGILLFYEQNNLSYFKTIFIDQFHQAITKYF